MREARNMRGARVSAQKHSARLVEEKFLLSFGKPDIEGSMKASRDKREPRGSVERFCQNRSHMSWIFSGCFAKRGNKCIVFGTSHRGVKRTAVELAKLNASRMKGKMSYVHVPSSLSC